MSNFKIGLKAVSILTAVYGWFIPLAFLPPFQRDSVQTEIDTIDELPQITQADFESLFDELSPPLEVYDEKEQNQEELQEALLEEHNKVFEESKEQKTPSKTKKITPEKYSKPIPEATAEVSLAESSPIMKPPKSSIHSLEKALLRQKTKKSKKNKKTKSCNPKNPDIHLLSNAKEEASYSLPKSLINHYSTNWKDANQLASLAWSTNREGEIQGIKIRHIYCQSPLRYSGLEKGDIILTVNGKNVNSNANLIRLFPRIRLWKTIELNIIRKGKPITLKYDILKS